MADSAQAATSHLLVYRFGSEADFEGRLVGALERLESGGALRVLDALFVHRDPDTGELEIASLKGDGAGSMAAPLLDFRLDAQARRRSTERALSGRGHGIPPELLEQLGATLEPGDALAALLVDHAWRRALEEAVERSHGTLHTSVFVDVKSLAELAPDLLAGGRAEPG